MSNTAPRRRPGAVIAASLLTWIASGSAAVLGMALLISSRTSSGTLTRALGQTVGLSNTAPASMYPTVGMLLLVAGAVTSTLALAAFLRSRVGLVGLTVAAIAYLLALCLAALNSHPLPGLLLGASGGVWIGLTLALLWWRKDWYDAAGQDAADQHDEQFGAAGRAGAGGAAAGKADAGGADAGGASAGGAAAAGGSTAARRTEPPGTRSIPVRRPANVRNGAGVVWLTGAAMVAIGARLAWSGFSELLDPASTAMLPGLTTSIGLVAAAIGVALAVLAAMTFTGSQDTLVALTVVGLIVLFLYLNAMLSTDSASLAILLCLLGVGWMIGAAALLWSRPAREWYRIRDR